MTTVNFRALDVAAAADTADGDTVGFRDVSLSLHKQIPMSALSTALTREVAEAGRAPRALLTAPHIARGWVDPSALMPFGTILRQDELVAIPQGWREFTAPASGVREIINWSPEALRTGAGVVQDFTVRPEWLYSNVAGTTLIAGPGAEVAAMRDSRGVMVIEQATPAHRMTYGVRPATGIRNLANGSALVANAANWLIPPAENGITITKAATGETANEPWVEYRVQGTATATSFNHVFDVPSTRHPAVSGQQFTASLKGQVVAGTAPSSPSGVRLDVQELNAANAAIQTTFTVLAITSTQQTFAPTRTFTDANTVQAQAVLALRVQSGETVDFTVRLTAFQFEKGAVRTAWQRNESAFDVTEAGVRTIHGLIADQVSDVMALTTAFLPAGAYTMAAAANFRGGVMQNVFGSATGSKGRLLRNIEDAIEVWADTVNNRSTFNVSGFPSAATGRSVNIARVSGTGLAEAWVNGIGPLAGSLHGAMTPMGAPGIDLLGGDGASRTSPEFFTGGVLVDRAITDADFQMLQRYLAYHGGITL